MFGMSEMNPKMAMLVKRVIWVSVCAALVQSIYYFIQIARGTSLWLATFRWLCALLVPACGYFGAKQSSRDLLGAYTCCNGIVVVIGIITLARFYALYNSSDNREDEAKEFWVNNAIYIPANILAALSFCFGSELYSKRDQIYIRAPPMVVNYQNSPVQPSSINVTIQQPYFAPQQPYVPPIQPPQGFAPQGYPPQGYPPQGYAPQGYAPQGGYQQGGYAGQQQYGAPPPQQYAPSAPAYGQQPPMAYAQPVQDHSNYK